MATPAVGRVPIEGRQLSLYGGVRVRAKLEQSADLEQTGVALIAPARPTAAFGSATQLFVADHR